MTDHTMPTLPVKQLMIGGPTDQLLLETFQLAAELVDCELCRDYVAVVEDLTDDVYERSLFAGRDLELAQIEAWKALDLNHTQPGTYFGGAQYSPDDPSDLGFIQDQSDFGTWRTQA